MRIVQKQKLYIIQDVRVHVVLASQAYFNCVIHSNIKTVHKQQQILQP